jgi:hypothetical protein
MLCLKESKGELHQFIVHTEKINWAIKHIDKAKYLVFIPGLQAVAANTERAKELIKNYQDLTLVRYLYKVSLLQKRCSQGPSSFLTPYQIGPRGFQRHFNGTTMWRAQWKTQIIGKYEVAQFEIQNKKINRSSPEVNYRFSISEVNALSRLRSLLGSLPSLSQASSL